MELEKKNEDMVINEAQEVNTDNEILMEEDNIPATPKKKKKLPGWFILVIMAVIIAIVILASVLSKNKSGSTQTKLTVTTVETSDVKEVLNTSGIIKSENEKVVYSPVNATVSQFAAKVGESVKKGTMLVMFDTKDLEKNNQQSQLNELATKYANQSTYEQTNRSIAKAAEAASTAEKQAVNQYNVVVNQYNDIANAIPGLQDAANAEMASNSALATPIQTQMSTLAGQIEGKTQELITMNANLVNYSAYVAAGGTLTEEQLRTGAGDLKNMRDELQAQYDDASKKLAEINAATPGQSALSAANTQLATLGVQLDSLKASLNTSTDSVDGLTGGQVKSMQISEQLANLATLSAEELVNLGKAGITAEFDGIIADVKTEVGSMVAQGGPLFTIVSNTEVGVKIEASTNDYDKLKVGRKAVIKISDKTYEGEVKSIDKIATTNAKGNSVICAYVHITNPDDAICIGVTGKVTMTVAEATNVIAVPSEVINTSTDGEFVYMIKKGVVKKVPVEIGVTSDKMVEIKSGLKKGDKVVSDVGTDITEGMKATAVEK